jgi:Xaa-Pro dipeptidase
MHRLATRVILDGLISANIVKGSYHDLLEHHIPALFFPHGLGHLIGIDVHDVGGYPKGVSRINEPAIKYLRMRRKLEAGMMVTVEPGVYFVDAILDPAIQDPKLNIFLNIPVLQEYRKVGGVRIEDDVLILQDSIENLTGWIPKTVRDIENTMNE